MKSAESTQERRERDGGPERRAGGPLLTAAQVGELLGVPKSWVYDQSRKGRIPTVTLGRYRRYRAEAIERWVEEMEAEGTHCAAAGVPMRTLQEWMGHAQLQTTEIYADYAPSSHEKEMVERAFDRSTENVGEGAGDGRPGPHLPT